jgi:hypothetical protein
MIVTSNTLDTGKADEQHEPASALRVPTPGQNSVRFVPRNPVIVSEQEPRG